MLSTLGIYSLLPFDNKWSSNHTLNASDVLTLRNIDDSPKPLFNGNVGIPAVISTSIVILRLV